MANPQTTTTKNPAKGTRDMWTVACADAGIDCSFRLTNHNQKQLVTMSLNHLRETHNMTKTDKDVLGMAKPGKW